jgi:hypothetical protein
MLGGQTLRPARATFTLVVRPDRRRDPEVPRARTTRSWPASSPTNRSQPGDRTAAARRSSGGLARAGRERTSSRARRAASSARSRSIGSTTGSSPSAGSRAPRSGTATPPRRSGRRSTTRPSSWSSDTPRDSELILGARRASCGPGPSTWGLRDSFRNWIRDWTPTFVATEATVFNRPQAYAGTLDAIVRIRVGDLVFAIERRGQRIPAWLPRSATRTSG